LVSVAGAVVTEAVVVAGWVVVGICTGAASAASNAIKAKLDMLESLSAQRELVKFWPSYHRSCTRKMGNVLKMGLRDCTQSEAEPRRNRHKYRRKPGSDVPELLEILI
jgi:hypothetical protein